MSKIKEIIEIEWTMFQKVKNEGGTADCQKDHETFQLMRTSQFETWNGALLDSYYQDLLEGEKTGWNLVMEKYARMMETTAPQKYQAIAHILPPIEESRKELMEVVVGIQVKWMESFAKEYPGLAKNARTIHTFEDEEADTSFETYLRGELCTYSDHTFKLYCEFIVDLVKQNLNLTKLTIEKTVRFYGYDSLDSAEKKLK